MYDFRIDPDGTLEPLSETGWRLYEAMLFAEPEEDDGEES